jgi:hypothetical protein
MAHGEKQVVLVLGGAVAGAAASVLAVSRWIWNGAVWEGPVLPSGTSVPSLPLALVSRTFL